MEYYIGSRKVSQKDFFENQETKIIANSIPKIVEQEEKVQGKKAKSVIYKDGKLTVKF